MSALARRHRVGQPGPGVPRLPRPAGGARRRPGRDRHRRRPVPARSRACRSCGPPSPSTGRGSRAGPTTPTPRCWSPPAPPRRWPRRMLALLEPGDEVVLFEPIYDSYSAGGRDGRRRGPPGAAAPAGGRRRPLDVRPGRRAGGDHPAHPAAAAQHPAQPDRQGASPPRSWRSSPSWPSRTTCWCSPTRSTSTWSSTGRGTSRRPRCPGMRERTLVVSSAGKTFNVTGWKVGWICGPAPLVAAVRTAKQFLTYVNGGPFQPAVAAGLRAAGRVLRRGGARPAVPPRRARAGPPGRRPAGVQPGGHVLRDRRRPARAARRRRPGVLPGAARAGRRRRGALGGVLRTGARRPGPAPGPVRVLQGRRGARRGRGTAGRHGTGEEVRHEDRGGAARHRLGGPRGELRPARPAGGPGRGCRAPSWSC